MIGPLTMSEKELETASHEEVVAAFMRDGVGAEEADALATMLLDPPFTVD